MPQPQKARNQSSAELRDTPMPPILIHIPGQYLLGSGLEILEDLKIDLIIAMPRKKGSNDSLIGNTYLGLLSPRRIV